MRPTLKLHASLGSSGDQENQSEIRAIILAQIPDLQSIFPDTWGKQNGDAAWATELTFHANRYVPHTQGPLHT